MLTQFILASTAATNGNPGGALAPLWSFGDLSAVELAIISTFLVSYRETGNLANSISAGFIQGEETTNREPTQGPISLVRTGVMRMRMNGSAVPSRLRSANL